MRGAVKPISTLARPLPSADLVSGEPVEKAHYERSDISVVPAAGVVGEAMVLLTLADFVLDKFGGDSIDETRDNLERYRERIARPVGQRSGRTAAQPEAMPDPLPAAQPEAHPVQPSGSGAEAQGRPNDVTDRDGGGPVVGSGGDD